MSLIDRETWMRIYFQVPMIVTKMMKTKKKKTKKNTKYQLDHVIWYLKKMVQKTYKKIIVKCRLVQINKVKM